MMSSSYPTSYQQRIIDHRTVIKRLQQQIPEVKSSKSEVDALLSHIFAPTSTSGSHSRNSSRYRLVATHYPRTIYNSNPLLAPFEGTAGQKSNALNKASKIPHPLTVIWDNKRKFPSKRSLSGGGQSVSHYSLRLRSNKSHLSPTMGPEALKTAARAGCSANSDGNSLARNSSTARRKRSSIAQKSSSKQPALNRSQSLRRNFKFSTKTDSPSGGDQRRGSSCAAAANGNIKSRSAHDVSQVSHNSMTYKDQGNQGTQRHRHTMEHQLSPEAEPAVGEEDSVGHKLEKLSLNHNGVHSSSASTPALATVAGAVATATTQTQTQHSRPSTLVTAASTPNTTCGGSGVLKTPRSPRLGTAIPAPEHPCSPHQRQHNHHQHHHHHQQQQQQQQQTKTSPDTKPTPKTPPVTPDSPATYLDDDLDSLYSYTTTSGRSTMSCEHPFVARNGTTFSGRKMKYVVHCSNYAGQVGADYLTPTQRAQRQIKRLKEMLCAARQDLEQKDSEILRLTREVVELRLFKASLSSPDERSASSDAVTVREAELKTSQDVSPIVDMVDDGPHKSNNTSPRHHSHHHGHHAASASPTALLRQSSGHHHHQHHHHHHHGMHDMQSSFADSGHFEDLTSSSVHSKDSSYGPSTHVHDQACGSVVISDSGDHHHEEEISASTLEQYELQRQELIRMYEQRIEDLIRSQDAATSDMKRSNNDRIEALLQKLAECNTRYADIVPDYEHAKERIRELEKQLEDLQRKLADHEEKQKQMYLHMYQKGQEAERIARADQALELAHRAPQNKVSINELLHQLQSTQDELENIRAAECRKECGSNHALLTAKEAISLWVLGARKTIYRRLLEAQKNRTHVDPEITLQFLKSAVYYFLTDKENSQGHLQAIESILEFSEAEKQNISKARNAK